MNAKEVLDLKIDKKAFSVATLTDQSDKKDYWRNKSPFERLRHLELLRRINYGSRATERLQRIFESSEL